MENPLPLEIVTEILSRLPAESVLECRRVCKTWCALTYHPSFAHLHLCHSLQLNDDFDEQEYQCHFAAAASSSSKVGFIAFTRSSKKGYQLHYGKYDDENDKESYKSITKINHPPIKSDTVFVGSCNGLICLTVFHNSMRDPVYLCNPITGEYVELPRVDEKLKILRITAFGFGYHPKTNEYKIVRIYYSYKYEHRVGQVQVYTVGSGLGWRNKGEVNYIFRFNAGVLANGALNWVDFNNERKIVSFDLVDEEFCVLPSPPCSGRYYQLKVLRGLLCAVHEDENGYAHIWSLKENEKNGVSQDIMKGRACQSWTWNLEFKIEIEGLTGTNFIFMSRYEIFAVTESEVLLWDDATYLSRYNLKTKFIESLVDYASVTKYFVAIPHINSFISLKALGEDAKIIGSAEKEEEARHKTNKISLKID